MLQSIDLNCDMGEEHPLTGENHDSDIMPYISSCNVSCGFHSGSPKLIEDTLRAAIAHDIRIGAHPSFRDRKNFGRVAKQQSLDELMADIRYQVSALKGMCESLGARLMHVKPHGALYNTLHKSPQMSEAFIKLIAVIDPKLKIMGLANSAMAQQCHALGIQYIHESFADRRYEEDGSLRSRRYENAVLHRDDEVMAQLKNIISGFVVTSNNTRYELQADSICLHSDTSDAVKKASLIRRYLDSHNVRILPHS